VTPALIALFFVVTVLLVVRAANRDKREYRRFKRLKTTRQRQRVLAKWLRESFLIFGGIAVAVLITSWNFIAPASRSALSWPPLAWLHAHLDGSFGVGFGVGVAVALLIGLVLPVVLLRRQLGEIATVGDIAALLPRTRGELKYGVGLSLNAGVVEELLFRLGMPALLFGILGNGVLAFALASVLFGLLHLYQKFWGVLGATVLGLLFSLVYLLSGSIWVVMALHAVIDLRSLVLIPLITRGVWARTTDSTDTPTIGRSGVEG
jgi:membrane protease YdiL (CAAX protease family)